MDFLDCKICEVPYDEDEHKPRQAPCGHGLCSACLKTLIKNSIFECPKCRQKEKVVAPDNLPVNFDLIDVIRSFKAMNTPLPRAYSSPISGASNYEICKLHWKSIEYRCLLCQMWICNGCLEAHSKTMGCSTVSSMEAMESMKEEHTRDIDMLVTTFENDSKCILSKIQDHSALFQEITDKRKELLDKAEQHSKEINKIQSILFQGKCQKENLVKTKDDLRASNTPYALMDIIEVLARMKQSLRSWSAMNLGNISTNISFGSLNQQSTSFGTAATPSGATTSTAGSLFGAQAAPATGGLFGQQQKQQQHQQPVSSFTQPTTGFGNTGGTSLFGQTQQPQPAAGGLFGSGGGFGAQAPKPGGFGFGATPATSTASGGLFGTAQPATGGLFGSTAGGFGANPGAAVTGTTVKYAPVTGTDTMTRNGVSTNIQTRIEVISTMKEYESKSLEELRVEDYLANRKGPGQGAGMGVGAFGQTSTAQPAQQPGGLFGSTTATSGLFGQTKPPENKPLFGATTSTTGFGATGGGLFGSTSTAASPFGQTNTAPTTGFSFGQTQNQTKPGGFSFGQTQPTSTGGIFGQTQTAQPVASTPGFGATTGGFGQPAPGGGLFPNKGFGATQAPSTGLFGTKPATTGVTPGFGSTTGVTPGFSGFGATSTPSPFGQTATAPTAGGLFGAQNTQQKTGGLFGQPTSNFATTGGGMFNNNQQKAGGINFLGTTGFGTPQQPTLGMGANMTSSLFSTGTPNQAATGFGVNTLGIGGNTGMGMQQGSVVGGVQPNLATLVKAMTQQPFQDIPLLKRTTQSPASGGDSGDTTDGASGAAKPSSGALKPTYVLSSSPANLIKPKPKPLNKGGGSGGGNGNRHWLFKGLDEPSEGATDDDPLKPKSFPSVKKLNLKVFKGQPKNDSAKLHQQQSLGVESTNGDAPSPLTTPLTTPLTNQLSSALAATPLRQSVPPSHENSPTPDIIKGRDKIKHLNLAEKQTQLDDTLADLNVRGIGNELAETAELNDTDAEANKENNISLFDVSTAEEHDATACDISSPHPAGVKLTRNGYYTLPPLEELAEMLDDQGKCLAENFTVGRQGYGNVCFLGTTDVSGLDLDTLIFILRKQVEVYPEGCTKPPQGHGLNKSAIITLDCVWPVDKTTREVIKSSERLELMQWAQYLERQCYKMESSFVEYRPDTGSWVFKVKHFSKYGLGDDDDDDAEMSTAKPPPSNIVKPLHGGIPPLTGRTTGPPATALASPLHHGPLASMASIAQQPAKQVFLDQESDMGEDPYMDMYAFQPVESAAYNIMSPSEERLNVASRVAPRTVQLMKSQLFSMDDDEGSQAREESPATPKHSAKKLMLQDKSLNMSSAMGSPAAPEKTSIKPKVILQPTPSTMEIHELDGESEALSVSVLRDPRSEYQVLPSGREIGKETGYAPPQHQAKPVPLDASKIAGQDRYLADMAAFMGRSFRVGWGPGWTLVHAGPSLAPGGSGFDESPSVVLSQPAQTPLASFLFSSATQTTTAKPSVTTESQRYRLTVEHVMCDELSDHSIDALTELTLSKVLECSIVSKDEMSDEDTPQCPYIQPETNTNMLEQISEHLNYMTSENAPLEEGEVNVANIFNLCMALWGNQDFYSPEFDGDSDYVKARVTVEAISQWIECCSSQIVDSEVNDATNSQEDDPEAYLKAVYSHLSARQISQASMLAQQKGDHHLALLLSQACGDETPRQYLAAQLANWAEGGTDAHMSILRLTIYSLLAGSPTHQASNTLINTCQGLDWKRAFGLHLWYISPATATISEALSEYETACGLTGEDPYCEAPLPSYIISKTLPKGMDVKHGYDVCYHLLKLFTDPTHKLEVLLNSWTISNDPLCVYVSWLLWSVLRSLGYHHLSDVAAASLNLAMAALLESEGHWHWAAFVLLHIQDNERRCGEVKQLIARHITLEEGVKEAEEFLTVQLRIPDKWLFEAKATMARSLHMIDEEAWYLLKAGNFNRAHKLIVDTIAPNAVINEDHEYLHRYLDQLSDPSIFENIVNWASGGAVYADYLDVISLVNEMKKTGEPTAAKLELLRPRLLTLCQRLNNLKCETAVHRLCVSEMSRVVVGVLRAVLGDGSEATQVLAQQLSSLPITHDYALAELNLVTTHYLTHLAEA